MAEHSKAPWVQRPLPGNQFCCEVYGADGSLVLGEESSYMFRLPEDEAHAVHCVNSHAANEAKIEALREALREAESALQSCYQVCDYPANGRSEQDYALASVRSALALSSHDREVQS